MSEVKEVLKTQASLLHCGMEKVFSITAEMSSGPEEVLLFREKITLMTSDSSQDILLKGC